MFTKKKKFILLSVMVVLLIATGVLNLVLNKNVVDTSTEVQTSAQFFASQREDRTLAREQELLYLNALISDESNSEETRSNAEAKRDKLLDTIEIELSCESLIKAAGFNDCFIIIGTNMFNVVVDTANLTDDDVVKISDIIVGRGAAELDNIIVSAIN